MSVSRPSTLKSAASQIGERVVHLLHIHQFGLEGGIRRLDGVEGSVLVVHVVCPYELRILIGRRHDLHLHPHVHDALHGTDPLGQRFGLVDENLVSAPVEPVLGGLGGLGGLGVHRHACLCENIRVPLYISTDLSALKFESLVIMLQFGEGLRYRSCCTR